jgi:hypothetical protein
MSGTVPTPAAKRSPVALTVGSKIHIRSSGGKAESVVSSRTYRGLVSIGGDNSLALELDGSAGASSGQTRLIPLNAVLAVELVEAAKPEEQKRVDSVSAGYFR